VKLAREQHNNNYTPQTKFWGSKYDKATFWPSWWWSN